MLNTEGDLSCATLDGRKSCSEGGVGMQRVVSFSILLIASLCFGCAPQNSPKPIASGAKFEIFTVTIAEDPAAVKATDPSSGDPLFLKSPPFITTTDVATVKRSGVEPEGFLAFGRESHEEPGMSVELTPTGAAKMGTATTALMGNQIAVVVNGKVISAPEVRSPIRNTFVVTGGRDDFESEFEALTKP